MVFIPYAHSLYRVRVSHLAMDLAKKKEKSMEARRSADTWLPLALDASVHVVVEVGVQLVSHVPTTSSAAAVTILQ